MSRTRYGRSKARKRERKEQASQRQENWSKLSIEQKLKELDFRPGESKKERAKLKELDIYYAMSAL